MRKILILIITVLAVNTLFGWDIIRQAAFPANFNSLDVIGSTVWAVGSGGAVAKSTDDGQTWAFVPSPFFDAVTPAYRTVEDVDFMSQNDGVAVGGMGIVAITADGGESWTYPATAQAVIGTTELKSAVYLPSGQIWVCGSAGMIAYSPDFGATWSLQNAGISTILYGMSMNDEGTGFIVLNKGTPDQSKILKTYNYGAIWTLENLPVTGNPSIFNVRQFENKVILVGDFGYLGYSDDNGASWTHHPYAAGDTTTDELHDVVMLGDTGYAVGWNYRIITTTDGGPLTRLSTTISRHPTWKVLSKPARANWLVAAGKGPWPYPPTERSLGQIAFPPQWTSGRPASWTPTTGSSPETRATSLKPVTAARL